jgi:hypothetical protein
MMQVNLNGNWLVKLLLAAILAAACAPSAEEVAVDKAEIQEALVAYLEVLGEAYATGNLELLREYAAEKEIASIERRMRSRLAEGITLEPTLQEVTVEEVDIWSYSNAYVTTVELWDLEVYTSGTHLLVSETRGQPNRVRYQLLREAGRWMVLYREVETTFE